MSAPPAITPPAEPGAGWPEPLPREPPTGGPTGTPEWPEPPPGAPRHLIPPPPEDYARKYAARLPWTGLEILVLIGIVAFGAALRFVHLSRPHGYIFDEIYYAKDACLYLHKGMAFCHSPGATEQSYVHPPLGKWIIAIGEWIWGYNNFGWRVMAAVFGTAMIPVVYLMARNLFGRWVGAMAGLLVATDFLLVVESRVAMLDIFLAFFISLGFLEVVYEHRRVLRLRESGVGRLDPRWRLAIGLTFGAATATKWSGGYGLVLAGALVLVWNVASALKIRERARAAGQPPHAPSPVAELNATVLAVGVPAILVYLVSYVAWFRTNHYSLRAFWVLQNEMYQFNVTLHATHPYASRPWTWPIIERPVAYYFTSVGGRYLHVLAFGNPFTWWAAILAFVYLVIRGLKARHSPERLVILAWLFLYLPWFKFSRTSFFYYMTPVVPFMMVALAAALGYLARGSRWRTVLVGLYLVVACGVALWFWYPILVGLPLPVRTWNWRMLFPTWI